MFCTINVDIHKRTSISDNNSTTRIPPAPPIAGFFLNRHLQRQVQQLRQVLQQEQQLVQQLGEDLQQSQQRIQKLERDNNQLQQQLN